MNLGSAFSGSDLGTVAAAAGALGTPCFGALATLRGSNGLRLGWKLFAKQRTGGSCCWAPACRWSSSFSFLGSWLYLPSSAEMSRLRAEARQLQASIDQLGDHGGRSQLMPCGASKELCVRVDPALGRYGETHDYFVVRGY